MVLIIAGRDWIAVSVAPSYISSALHQSRMPRGTFLVAGRRFRRRLSPFARKLGRNSKNASMEPFLLRQFITARARNSNTPPVPRSSQGTAWYNRRWNVVLVRKAGEQTLWPPPPSGQLSRFLASRSSILRNLIAREFRSRRQILSGMPAAARNHVSCRREKFHYIPSVIDHAFALICPIFIYGIIL